MSCGCGGSSPNIENYSNDNSLKTVYIPTSPEDCIFDYNIIQIYKDKLEYVKNNSLHNSLGLSNSQVNSYLGVFQSALNYPDNYCLFEEFLTKFKTEYLPKIIENGY